MLSNSLSQEDWEALYGATDEGLVLDRLVWPLSATAAAIIVIPLLLWLLLRFLPNRAGTVAGVVVLAWSAIYPAIYLVEFWFSLAWTVLVVLLTYLGWAHLTHWTLVRALREIPDSLRQSLFYLPLLLVAFLFFFFNSNLWQLAVAWNITQALLVALLLWTMGALVCVVTVNRHVETVLQEVESTLPLRVKLNIRWNAASVHLAQASIFGLLVFVGFFVFGLAAVPQATIATWTGTPTVLVTLGPLSFSGALVKVSWVLGGFASLYMATTAAGDRERREEHLGPVTEQMGGVLRRVWSGAGSTGVGRSGTDV